VHPIALYRFAAVHCSPARERECDRLTRADGAGRDQLLRDRRRELGDRVALNRGDLVAHHEVSHRASASSFQFLRSRVVLTMKPDMLLVPDDITTYFVHQKSSLGSSRHCRIRMELDPRKNCPKIIPDAATSESRDNNWSIYASTPILMFTSIQDPNTSRCIDVSCWGADEKTLAELRATVDSLSVRSCDTTRDCFAAP